ncbi:MAG: ATP-dependent helicase HrpB, partial [Alphaproteobacteria bacterium]
SSGHLGLLVALAYPDRIAQRRPGGEGQFRLAGGGGAVLHPTEPLAAADWLAVADLDGARRDARIHLAAPLTVADLEEGFADRFVSEAFVRWEPREEAVLARRRLRLDELVLRDEPLRDPDPALLTAAMVEGVRTLGLAALPWSPEAQSLRARIAFLRVAEGEADWPDLSDAALLAGLDAWLAPHLAGLTRRAHLKGLDLAAILRDALPWPKRQALDALAPTHVTVPSGSRIPIDYADPTAPVLAVRLQEMFGATDTPRLAGGRVALTLHLLSPAGRPMQVTRDLASFWAGAYREVRADLRGRYPKHHWPDDPLTAEPTNRTRRRSGG